MHILLISACTHRALKRTRKVLDSYATRVGDSAWATPITQDGLDVLHEELRKTATRQTAVCCYRNDGRDAMQQVWTVGRKTAFGPHGAYPIATTKGTKPDYPHWLKVAFQLVTLAGLVHDLGKLLAAFQDSLHNPRASWDTPPTKQPVRHEWLSVLLVELLLTGRCKTIQDAWDQVSSYKPSELSDARFLREGLDTPIKVLYFLVSTHHQLPDAPKNTQCINTEVYVRDALATRETSGRLPVNLMQDIQIGLNKLAKLAAISSSGTAEYWRSIALYARAGFILADHTVSSVDRTEKSSKLPGAGIVYANTYEKLNKRRLNQTLEWHLREVSHAAGRMMFNLHDFAPEGIDSGTRERIRNNSSIQRFFWQDTASAALRDLRQQDGNIPVLVINLAGTGAGKTLMNLKAADAVAGARQLRVAIALSLRTLTLQTGDAYTKMLGLKSSELSTLVGDRVTQLMHAHKTALDMETTTADTSDMDYLVHGEQGLVPFWLAAVAEHKKYTGPVLNAPILVSTADFLVAAGEPHKQGNHAIALLRLMTSDLVLDEVDSYDPKSLLAILRMVFTAAMWGRNVIASSATQPWPIANALCMAFQHGVRLRAAREQPGCQGEFGYAIINNGCKPITGKLQVTEDVKQVNEQFKAGYDAAIAGLVESLKGDKHRIPKLIKVPLLTKGNWRKAIVAASLELHDDNHMCDPVTGKKLSFGLIRVSNIRTAVPLARYLADNIPDSRVSCYHSRLFSVHRFHLESRLDALLSRKQGDEHIFKDKEIRKILDDPSNDAENVLVIIVATPVEEIGRDHDFDWGILEPASVHSMIQAAGRVNRHRLLELLNANVGLLQYTADYATAGGKSKKTRAWFSKPGLEMTDNGVSTHKHHNLEELLNWQVLEEAGQIDVRMRVDHRHKFAEYDDASLVRQLEQPLKEVLGLDLNGNLWMAHNTYTDYPLRDKSFTESWTYRPDARKFSVWRKPVKDKYQYVEKDSCIARTHDRHEHDIFVPAIEDIQALAEQIELSEDEAFSVRLPKLEIDGGEHLWDKSFGFYQTAKVG